MKRHTRLLLLTGLIALPFGASAQAWVPGDVSSAGLSYIIPDTPVWYNVNQLPGHPFPGYVTNGPIYNLSDQLSTKTTLPTGSGNYGNWEPYLSVVGESTFLVGCGIFADDGSWNGSTNLVGAQANQRYVLTLQPAAGGAPKVAEAFYDDFGNPYAMHQMMRQRNPGVRVAGDKRAGATGFVAGGSAALMYGKFWLGIDYFNSDGRLNTSWPLYGTGFGSMCNNVCSGTPAGTTDSQWVFLQSFSLNPTSLLQTPLSKAQEIIYYPTWTNSVPPELAAAASGSGGSQNVSYFGGDVVGLDNGNYVVVVDDYTGFFGTTPNSAAAVAKIFRPDGTTVKAPWVVDPREIWANVAAYQGGFAVRVQTLIYFYDNNGTAIATNSVRDSSGVSFDVGRGDAHRLASDIRSHFVYLAGAVNIGGGSNVCMLGIWDGRNGAFVTNAIVSSDLDSTPGYLAVDRVNLAVDSLDRVCVAFAGKPDVNSGFSQWQTIARVLKFDGQNVTYLTPSFFPFMNADNAGNVSSNGILGFITSNPAVAMTKHAICIAAKAFINSTNNPSAGPDAGLETTVYTVISMPKGGADSVGLQHIVPDMPVWYSSDGYITNGPVDITKELIPQDNWEPYISVLGDSTFLVGMNQYASDQSSQNGVVALQPADGSAPPKIVNFFYQDSGTPFTGKMNLSRQNGNPWRVAGDKRYGAMNYLTAAEASLGQLPEFQSNTRWTINSMYTADNRYVCQQPHALNPLTLVPTPLVKAWDFVWGPFSTNATGWQGGNQLSRTGARPVALDNGNFAVVIDDRTGYLVNGEVTTFSIITPQGAMVKSATLVDARDIFDNVCAYRGGFAVRVHDMLYFYDNSGNLKGNISVPVSTGLPFGTGREDASHIGSDIRSYYVYVAGQAPENGTGGNPSGPIYVAVYDSRTQQLVAKTQVSDGNSAVEGNDRVDVTADAYDRFCVVWANMPVKALFPKRQVLARVMRLDGTNIVALTDSFFPFVNYQADAPSDATLQMETFHASVAMTPRQICIAAKGHINSTNNPSAGADTALQTQVYTVISHPAPMAPPQPQITVTRSGTNAVFSWPVDAGLFKLQKTTSLAPAAWTDVTSQHAPPPITTPIGSGNAYFRLVRNW